jgi:predicted transcriptional regulator
LSKTPDHLSAKIRDFMEVPAKVIPEDAKIDQASETMWDLNIGSVIVIDKTGRMAGILTARDIL